MIHQKKSERNGMWIFPREVVNSDEWLNDCWEQRGTLTDKNMLILWGEKDIAFGEAELNTWKSNFPDAKVVKLTNAGHLPHEEEPEKVLMEIHNYLNQIRES